MKTIDMQEFQFTKKQRPTKYTRLTSEEKEFINNAIIDLRSDGVHKTYRECIDIIKNKWNVKVERFRIYDIVRGQDENEEEGKTFITYEEVDDDIRDEIFRKMFSLKVARAKMRMQDFANEVLDEFGVKLSRDDIESVVQRCLDANQKELEKLKKKESVRVIKEIFIEVDGEKYEIEYEVHNVVFHGNLFPENEHLPDGSKKSIDLNEFVSKNLDVKYNPDRFPGAVIQIDPFSSSKSTILLFESGSFVAVGLKSIDKIEKIKKSLVRRINKTKMKVKTKEIDASICNIVLTTKIPSKIERPLDLNALTLLLDYAMYEPEVFPGLIHKPQFKINNKKVQLASFLVFSTKRVVCAGIKKIEYISAILSHFVKSIIKLGDVIFINDSIENIPDKLREVDLS